MKTWLSGKKTYLTAAAAIVAVALAWIDGGVSDYEAAQAAIGALLAIFIRSGVHTETEKL